MSELNCAVDNARSMLIYEKPPEIAKLTKRDVSFNISSYNSSQDEATFQMHKNGEVFGSHQSQPFPKGALKQSGIDVTSVSCIVKLKKNSPIDLNDYF
ncbi:hypothetical protein PoB_006238400 [Plakobranchus ocellatus]|uniref:Uncharacterized protein n=1 Tax=Plakobranchus ocellatus TaxID=259542 RepID=A0AAV4CVG8_9GAST|nr:hypothetical protein PoB_006238400 [Plakobranchus ocellatus]